MSYAGPSYLFRSRTHKSLNNFKINIFWTFGSHSNPSPTQDALQPIFSTQFESHAPKHPLSQTTPLTIPSSSVITTEYTETTVSPPYNLKTKYT